MSHVSVCQLHVTRSSITNWKFALRTRSESNWRNCFKLPPDLIFLGLSQGHGQSVPSPLTRLPVSVCKTAWILSVQIIYISFLQSICIAATSPCIKNCQKTHTITPWEVLISGLGLIMWSVNSHGTVSWIQHHLTTICIRDKDMDMQQVGHYWSDRARWVRLYLSLYQNAVALMTNLSLLLKRHIRSRK